MGVARIPSYQFLTSWLLLPTALQAESNSPGFVPAHAVVRGPEHQQTPSTQIVLTFSASHDPIVNGQSVPWKQLDQQLRAIYTLRPRKLLVVQADSTKDGQPISRVIQIAKRRGVSVELHVPKAG